MTVALEVERKYVASDDLVLPPLDDLPGVTAEGPPRALELDATYFDTPDLRLSARNVRLRRRTGDDEAGWHLKLPGSSGVSEVRLPLGRSLRTVPVELRRQAQAFTRGAALGPVARIRTRRTQRDLLGPDGRALAHITDDQTSGSSLGATATLIAWREIEVELGAGDAGLLDAVEERLLAHGFTASTSKSKITEVLGDDVRPAWPAQRPEAKPDDPAADVAVGYLREQVSALLEWDPKLRRDEFDSVHKMRVSSRRLRSALRTFRALLDRDVTDPIGVELKWLAAELGKARDQEVQRDALLQQVTALPAELVVGPVARRIRAELSGGYDRAHAAVLEELSSARYFALLDRLDQLILAPPLTELAVGQSAQDAIPALVQRAYRRLRRDMKAALSETDPSDRDIALHEARKSAKWLRYACESVSPTFGSDAERLAAAAEDLQEVLGEHQDGVVRRGLLKELAAKAHEAGEDRFTYGVLAGLAHERDLEIEAQLPVAWRAAKRKKLRTWLS